MGEAQISFSNSSERRAWLCVAAILTFVYHPMAGDILDLTWPEPPRDWQQSIGRYNWYCGCELVMGLVLAVPTWRVSGLRIGDIRNHWLGVLLICGLPLALTAIVYPLLPSQPFAGVPAGIWLLSPAAQDMVYSGFLYGQFERLYPDFIHPRIRIRWAVIVTAFFFSAWHIRNFENMDPRYVCFQLVYTFAGAVWVGMSRQWTGSMLYGLVAHMAGNYIASRPAG